MTDILQRALPLWAGPLATGPAGLEAFGRVYHDPLTVNGEVTPLITLVERARMMQAAFADLHHEVLQTVETPDRVAFAFRICGRHIGSLVTPLGSIEPTGRSLDVLGLDIFELSDGRVKVVWAVADHLALLMQDDAVALDQGD